VSDLVGALAGYLRDAGALRLVVGGSFVDPAAAVADLGVRSGEHLLLLQDEEPPPPHRRHAGRRGAARAVGRGGRHSIGRGSDSDLRITDPSISRSPAWIVVDGRQVLVERIEMRQAIRVDGRPLSPPSPLAVGQVFEMEAARMVVADIPGERPPGPGRGLLAMSRDGFAGDRALLQEGEQQHVPQPLRRRLRTIASQRSC